MTPSFELNIYQKRQATLIYHYISMEYLLGLKKKIDTLIAEADSDLQVAQEQGRDALIVNPRWGARDTAANWATYGYSALQEFQESTSKLIAYRNNEIYCGTGAYQCGHLLGEISMLWATEEEEKQFKEEWEEIYSYAANIDDVTARQASWHDFSLALEWRLIGAQFPLLPKFRVHVDIEAETDKPTPRTGVYVSQDDPYGALQFGWAGDDDGALGEVETLNAFGIQALQSVGRDNLWVNDQAMAAFANRPENQTILKKDSLVEFPVMPKFAPSAIARSAFTSRPCKWYFVEMLPDQWEAADEQDHLSGKPEVPDTRLRAMPREAVPVEGNWYTPAIKGEAGRRYMKQGQALPDVMQTEYGAVIWYFDSSQQC